MLRRTIIGLIVLAVVGAFVWALMPKPVAVDAARIAKRSITVEISEDGKSRIREVFTVSAPTAGTMLRVSLHPGDAVVAGQTVVASIRPVEPALLDARSRRIAEAAVEAATAAVDLAAAQVKQAESQRNFLRSEAQRALTLRMREAISDRASEKAELDLQAAEAAVESARASLAVRRQELESARAALIESGVTGEGATCCVTVRSPANGRVLRVLTESEQVVQPGTPLVEIGDPGDIEVEVDLLSADAVRVAPEAAARVDGWGGAPLSAKVARIEPSAFTKVSALGIEEQRVRATLSLDGPPTDSAALGDGFRVTAHITVWQGDDLVAVPIGALFRSGDDWAVYVVAEGRAVLRRIVIGERNGSFAQVVEGLSEGDIVILHPGDMVSDGVRVEATIED